MNANERFEQNLNLILSVFGFWGLYCVYSSKMQNFAKQERAFEKLYDVIQIMAWLRVVVFILLVFILLIILIVICVTCLCGLSPAYKKEIARMPLVKQYLRNKARPYDPSKHAGDKNVPSCAICLDNFSSDSKKVAELRCKHIFHVGCLKTWVETNDICPMCRAPIIEKTGSGQ